MWRSPWWTLAVCAVGLAIAPKAAVAVTTTFYYEGVIDSVLDQTAAPEYGSSGGVEGDFGIKAGTTFSGFHSFDTALVDSDPTSGKATYEYGTGTSFALGSVALHSSSQTFRVFDDQAYYDSTPDDDLYEWGDGLDSAGRPEQFTGPWLVQHALGDTTGAVFDSEALPAVPPPLGSFDVNIFTVMGDLQTCHPIPWDACDSSMPEYRSETVFIHGHVTFLAVPEPSTVALFAVSLLSLTAMRRMRRA